ncbi:O-antigen/teichoic acid export membrane protein [Lysobacter sp. HA35]
MPFVLAALGPALFGTWATLVSFVALAGFLDFGLGNGAMNLVASAHGRNSADDVAAITRVATRAVAGIAALLLVPGMALVVLAPWSHWLGAPSIASSDVKLSVAVVLGSVLASAPLNVAGRVQLGRGRGESTFKWQAFGQALSLVLLVVLSKLHAGLPALVSASVCGPLLGSAINTRRLQRETILPHHYDATSDAARRRAIWHEGLAFFALQLCAALAFSIDLSLVSAYAGPERAGTYALAQRLFSVIPLGLALILAPLWPTYRQALASGHRDWVARTLRRSLAAAAVISGVAALTLFEGFDRLVAAWVHRPIEAAASLVAGFAAWCVLESVGATWSAFLNAASVLRYQVATSVAFATLCFAAKVALLSRGEVAWLPWATVTTYLVINVPAALIFGRRIVAAVFARTY